MYDRQQLLWRPKNGAWRLRASRVVSRRNTPEVGSSTNGAPTTCNGFKSSPLRIRSFGLGSQGAPSPSQSCSATGKEHNAANGPAPSTPHKPNLGAAAGEEDMPAGFTYEPRQETLDALMQDVRTCYTYRTMAAVFETDIKVLQKGFRDAEARLDCSRGALASHMKSRKELEAQLSMLQETVAQQQVEIRTDEKLLEKNKREIKKLGRGRERLKLASEKLAADIMKSGR